jgi:signal transduction histidine kinase
MAWFRRLVVLPLIGLTAKVEQLASGNHAIEIGLTERGDEIGGLARAMRSFRDALRETHRLRAEQSRAQAETEAANLAVQVANQQLERRVEERTQELLTAQQELIRKERLSAIGQLTATVAHELRNPLNAIRNTVVAMRTMASGHDLPLERPIFRIERSVVRCNQIVAELLDFARTSEPKLRPVQGDRWVGEVLDDISLPGGITLERDLGAPNAQVALDHERFRRVLINLIDNAAQAIQGCEGDERRVMVSTCASQAFEIMVEDTGPGISPENLPKIFEPLFSTKSSGTGLGLPTVKQIVEQHGGTITIASEVGKGTVVTVRLAICVPQEVIAA